MFSLWKKQDPREMKFRLIGQPREGGYTFVSSPELAGFTFMLEPQERSIETAMEAIKPALAAYLTAHLQHIETADRIRLEMKPFFLKADFSGPNLNLFAEARAA